MGLATFKKKDEDRLWGRETTGIKKKMLAPLSLQQVTRGSKHLREISIKEEPHSGWLPVGNTTPLGGRPASGTRLRCLLEAKVMGLD